MLALTTYLNRLFPEPGQRYAQLNCMTKSVLCELPNYEIQFNVFNFVTIICKEHNVRCGIFSGGLFLEKYNPVEEMYKTRWISIDEYCLTKEIFISFLNE